jgi:aquaporin Z
MIRKLMGEGLGTALLVLAMGGAALVSQALPGAWTHAIVVGLASGIALAILYQLLRPVSGGHFNPAVTLALASAGRLSFQEVVPYIVAQIFGAMAGMGVLHLANIGGAILPPGHDAFSLGPFHRPVIFATEAIATGLLVVSYLVATHKRARPDLAAVIVGLSLAVLQAALLYVSTGVLNPARALAIALYLPEWAPQDVWLFILAGIAGGVIAGIVWSRFLEDDFLRKPE